MGQNRLVYSILQSILWGGVCLGSVILVFVIFPSLKWDHDRDLWVAIIILLSFAYLITSGLNHLLWLWVMMKRELIGFDEMAIVIDEEGKVVKGVGPGRILIPRDGRLVRFSKGQQEERRIFTVPTTPIIEGKSQISFNVEIGICFQWTYPELEEPWNSAHLTELLALFPKGDTRQSSPRPCIERVKPRIWTALNLPCLSEWGWRTWLNLSPDQIKVLDSGLGKWIPKELTKAGVRSIIFVYRISPSKELQEHIEQTARVTAEKAAEIHAVQEQARLDAAKTETERQIALAQAEAERQKALARSEADRQVELVRAKAEGEVGLIRTQAHGEIALVKAELDERRAQIEIRRDLAGLEVSFRRALNEAKVHGKYVLQLGADNIVRIEQAKALGGAAQAALSRPVEFDFGEISRVFLRLQQEKGLDSPEAIEAVGRAMAKIVVAQQPASGRESNNRLSTTSDDKADTDSEDD